MSDQQPALIDIEDAEPPEYLVLIREARLNVSASVRAIAERADCSPQTVSNVLRGRHGMSEKRMQRLAAALAPEGSETYQAIVEAHSRFVRAQREGQLTETNGYIDGRRRATNATAILEIVAAVNGLTVAVERLTDTMNRQRT